MNHLSFSGPERVLALIAGILNLIIGFAFFFLPELPQDFQLTLWPGLIPAILARFIGAIILGNGCGAVWLSTEHEWARVRPLALVAVVYGTLVAVALLYHLLIAHNTRPSFWFYFYIDTPFLLVFYGLFIYHDVIPRFWHQKAKQVEMR